ncbi:MAG: rhomboid family intramembrane serine protease [Candidatus Methylomirabilia bacterium]
MEKPTETAVCVNPNAKQAEERAVVLAAGGIAYRLEETDAGWALVVSARDATRARDALAAYDEESRHAAVADAPPPGYGVTWIGALVAALLVGFFAVTGPRDGGVAWFGRGSASAEQILKGEVWRTVTALTLHADLAHVLGNAVACVVLVTAVGRWLGPGIGSWLVLLAGAGGNALTALAHGSHHISVGASTSTFGAVGILAALQFVARRRGRAVGRKAWVVVAASLVLLGMLGTAAGSDLLAHLFGLLVGGGLGIGAALALRRPPGRLIQWALVLAAAMVVVGCWWIALATAVTHR